MNAALYKEIEWICLEKGWTKTDLAQRSGIHISEISRLFNHKRSVTLKYLDAITEAIELEEGALYSYFAEECFNEEQLLDKRKSVQFLFKCFLKGYEEHCEKLLQIMTTEKSDTARTNYLNYIFFVAEELFKAGEEEKAMLLYEIIIENDSKNSMELLAISYFRRFYILRMTDDAQHALTDVLEYLFCMPKKVIKEAYLWIVAFYYWRERWEEVLYYAERLRKLVKDGEYYGRALMYKSFALARLGGTLEEIVELTDCYAQVNDYFADLAIGNRLASYLDFGYLEYVDQYLTWLEDREDVHIGLPKVLEAYIHLNRLEDAKKILDLYKHKINELDESVESWLKQKVYLEFRYAYALFQCESLQFPNGLDELLDVAYVANQIGNLERFNKCLLVYWRYKHHATSNQINKYIQLLSINGMKESSSSNFA
ncbi:helix-turn-helix domain-containing protein [Gottfriedia sp. NPDC056225]|uniref:helix-turn-helix domain-containing protein n=1 Tax=Gottfriedia sp. NPDC056225 TaxID=3345751 RepID=UPI0015586E90|nr:helix-turn-helix transcriptional regulator [Arthrobacter citreus]